MNMIFVQQNIIVVRCNVFNKNKSLFVSFFVLFFFVFLLLLLKVSKTNKREIRRKGRKGKTKCPISFQMSLAFL